MKTHCSVPAKLILSGEHAVLYHCPALSMAVNLKTECWAEFKPNPTASITIELVNFQQKHSLPFDLWQKMSSEIESRFQLFEDKTGSIQSVLSKPLDLILEVLYHFNAFCPLKAGEWQFKIESEAPIGRGLGSSAAVILSLLSSLIKQHNLELTPVELLALAQKIECRQHGRSSGIDPATLIYGGLLQYQTHTPIQKIESQNLKAWLIDTQRPEGSTGQCVELVRELHGTDQALWDEFTEVTETMVQAWKVQHSLAFKDAIQSNHKLLVKIGVVPAKVQEFITRLETEYQAVAKVCGAGSISGDSAGMLICISEHSPAELCETYHYSCQPLALQTRGIICEELHD